MFRKLFFVNSSRFVSAAEDIDTTNFDEIMCGYSLLMIKSIHTLIE